MKKVNLFIVGAPKCGTTSMTYYLSQHPCIQMSKPKEIHYFATNMENYRLVKTLEDYHKIFNFEDEKIKYFGEASVWYLYSKIAIKNIYEYNPNAKIIVMLRNPIEMVYSNYYQMKFNLRETIDNFEEAWEAQKDRENNKKIPKFCLDKKTLYYKDIAKYAEQLENLFKYFNKEQVHIILYDDLKQNIKGEYKKLLQFLNLKYINKIDFSKQNISKVRKSNLLAFIYKFVAYNTPDLIKNIDRNIAKLSNGYSLGKFLKRIDSLNRKLAKKKDLSYEMKKKILDNYIEDISKLENILNRDLSHWKKI